MTDDPSVAPDAAAPAAPRMAPLPRGPLWPLRAMVFGVGAFVWTFVSFLLGQFFLLSHLRSGGHAHVCARMWAVGIFLLGGLRLRVHGREHLARGVVRMAIANHTSYLDPPTMARCVPGKTRFLLKRELLSLPFIGWYAKWARHFLVDRSDPRQGMALQQRAVEQIRDFQHVPVVFPEGTRSHDGRLAELRAGAFDLAMKAGIDVQPVWIQGAFERMPRGAAFPRRGGTIHVHIGPAIPIAGHRGSAGRRALASQATAALRDLAAQAGAGDV
jgi:1-acyl-sn-glycerol-3-phosphate acyltransferase